MIRRLITYSLVLSGMWVQAQKKVTQLFSEVSPLEIKLSYSFKEIRKSTADSVYFPTQLSFIKTDGQWDSIPVEVRARGNFRRKHCSFTPIRIKIKKKNASETVLDGNKSMKLVLPCQPPRSFNNLLYREYLCYQFYEVVSPYHFETRLIDLTLTDTDNKKPKTYTVSAFLVEDNDLVARRFKGAVVDRMVHPLQFHDTLSVQHDLFQYLIGNTDWSAYAGHNESTIQVDGKFIALPYDFDMAGLVNASYATVNEELSIQSVTERLFRGYCRSESLFETVRAQYLKLEPKIYDVLKAHEKYFDAREFQVISNFVDDFFSILKNDRHFKINVVMACRN